MEYVAPGAAYSSRLSLGPDETGLVGTVRFRLLDNDATADDPFYGPSSVAIVEDPTGSGSYVFAGIAPTVQGKYSPAWDTGPGTPLIYDEDLVVTRTALFPSTPSGNEYISRDELKEILMIQDEDYANLAIDIAIGAACGMIDGYKQTPFYPATETRYYEPGRYDRSFALDELVEVTELAVDIDGDGTYSEIWTEGTDFYLDPPNAGLTGRPSRELVLRSQGGRRFPNFSRSVRISGTFGWATAPVQVKQAAILIANRLLTRTRSAPLGILIAASAEAVATARLGQVDPDVANLLDNIPGLGSSGLKSLQLG